MENKKLTRKEYRKAYYLLHKKEIVLKAVEWGRKNVEKRNISKRKWRDKNKDLTNFYTKNRIYKIRGAKGSHTQKEIKELFKKHNNLCIYCHAPATSIDHLNPISKGGSNSIDNLAPCCTVCNSRKGGKFLWFWLHFGRHRNYIKK